MREETNKFGTYYYLEGEPTHFFSLFGLNAHFYSFAVFLAALTFVITLYFFWKRADYDFNHLLTICWIIGVLAAVGARLFYIIERLIYSPEDPFGSSAWYKFWEGGLSLHGGLILPTVTLLIWVYKWRDQIDWRLGFSYVLTSVILGLGIGRWGNFTNHEVFGKEVTLDHPSISWLPQVIQENMHIHARLTDAQGETSGFDPVAKYYAPLFFYDFLSLVFGYIIIVWVFNLLGWFKPGSTGAMFMIYHGIIRIIMEPLRNESYSFYLVIAWLFIIFGTGLLIYFEFDYHIKSLFLFRPKPRYKVVKKGYYYDYERIEIPQITRHYYFNKAANKVFDKAELFIKKLFKRDKTKPQLENKK